MNIGFIPIRKQGKLPGEKELQSYDTEYSTATIEMQKGCLEKGDRVVVVDDLLATGGTADAGIKLVKRMGGDVVGVVVVIELVGLQGRSRLQTDHENIPVYAGL